MKKLALFICLTFSVTAFAQDAYKDNIKAAKKGDMKAQLIIGDCYFNGTGIPKDDSQAFSWWEKAANQGSAIAQYQVGFCYANSVGVSTNYQKAFYWWKKAAEQGFDAAQNSLGNCYNSGEGVGQDFVEAFKWYERSAEQGNMYAQFNLHTCYYFGRGVESDKNKAFNWVKKSAEQGYVQAQFNLGSAYFYGTGVEKDCSLGLQWWNKAAEQGNAEAQFDLSNCYFNGDGVDKNLAKYIYWCKKAAENGLADAQYNLSLSYYNGEGVEKDYVQSFYWCKKAAEQGLVDAQLNLGINYFTATGVAQDMEQGVYWYRKAAERGKPGAQYNLGTCYLNGWGVNKDYDQAVLWIKKAANQGHVSAIQWLKENDEPMPQNSATNSRDISSNTISSDVDVDIPDITQKSNNVFAVVIGNEKYKNEEDVPYAENDAMIFGKYLEHTLGIPQEQIKHYKNATYNDLRMAINWLVQSMKICKGKGKAIFYYAGHGIPSESDLSSYLLPVDGIGNDPGSAYSLKDMYEKLGSVEAQSITILLDACFSGSKREDGMLTSARGVAIKAKQSTPQGNMIVFSAAQGDETAYPYKEKQHGMFTYYLLRKMQETKGEATLGELFDYVSGEVSRQSFIKNNKKQTPSISVSSTINFTWKNQKLK